MKVVKWGNSLALRLPAEFAKLHGLEEGDEVDIVVSRKPPEVDEATRREALIALRQFRGRLPADFKFDREEAHERGYEP